MERKDFNPQMLNRMFGIVAKKIGKNPDELRAEFESGKFDSAFSKMNAQEQAQFNQAVKNPSMVKNFLSSQKAQELYKKLGGGN